VSTRDFSWGKGGRCVWLTTYHPCSAETLRKSGALTYAEPLGPPRPVAGDLYFFFSRKTPTVSLGGSIYKFCCGTEVHFIRSTHVTAEVLTNVTDVSNVVLDPPPRAPGRPSLRTCTAECMT